MKIIRDNKNYYAIFPGGIDADKIITHLQDTHYQLPKEIADNKEEMLKLFNHVYDSPAYRLLDFKLQENLELFFEHATYFESQLTHKLPDYQIGDKKVSDILPITSDDIKDNPAAKLIGVGSLLKTLDGKFIIPTRGTKVAGDPSIMSVSSGGVFNHEISKECDVVKGTREEIFEELGNFDIKNLRLMGILRLVDKVSKPELIFYGEAQLTSEEHQQLADRVEFYKENQRIEYYTLDEINSIEESRKNKTLKISLELLELSQVLKHTL